MPSCSSPAKLSSPWSEAATLLLIENSSSMSTVWHAFRDRYLPDILQKLQGPTRGSSSPSTFFIESGQLSSGLNLRPQYKLYQEGSCDLEFEHDVTSRLSVDKIHNGIDLLTSIAIQRQPFTLHLVIVAASTPVTDYHDSNSIHYTSHSSWLQLAERMSQENIQCHLVLKSDTDVSPFETLFEETLRLRNAREAHLPFSIERAGAIIRLTEGHTPNAFQVAQPNLRGRSSLPSHTRTIALDSSEHNTDYANKAQTPSEMPSLVAQLQQKHGLTKKKVYGTKPPRTPFFRDDPPCNSYRKPLPLSLVDMTMTPGGRSAPLSRLDRMARMSHRTPTDSSRRWHTSTKLSSTDGAMSSYVPHQLQHTSMYAPIPVQHMVGSDGFYYQSAYDSTIDPQWGMPTEAYPLLDPRRSAHQDIGYDAYASSFSDSPSPASSSYDEPPALKYDAAAPPASSTSSTASLKAASTPKDDEPFTFDPAFIAATAVMFRQEVLPAYPELADSYSRGDNNGGTTQAHSHGCDTSVLPFLPASKAGQLYAAKYSVAACHQQSAAPLATSEPASSVPQYPIYSGTSSLTGWAG